MKQPSLDRISHPLPLDHSPSTSHLSAIRAVNRMMSLVLEVYPILAFSSNGGALPAYNRMNDALAKEALLPLPLLSSRHLTPVAFGQPLDFRNWSTSKHSFLHIFPRRFTIPPNKSVRLSLMTGNFFLIAIELSLNAWSLPSSCIAQC